MDDPRGEKKRKKKEGKKNIKIYRGRKREEGKEEVKGK